MVAHSVVNVLILRFSGLFFGSCEKNGWKVVQLRKITEALESCYQLDDIGLQMV